jgi:hypothetical protein
MGDRKETMIRAAYTAEGAKHSKSVIFWLGGGWKVPAVVGGLLVVALVLVKGASFVTGHAGALLVPLGVLVLVVGVVVALILIARGGGRGRRF